MSRACWCYTVGCSPIDFGQALHLLTIGQRLKRLGIYSRIACGTALMDNAATMPAVALSDLLGLSTTGAVRRAALAGATGNAYAAGEEFVLDIR